MNLPATFFPAWLLIISAIMGFIACGWAIRLEKWLQLPQAQINSWLCCSVIVLMAWQLKAQVHHGLAFHLLGVSALTLIAGPRRALLSIAVLLAIDLGFGHGDLATWGLSLWLIGLLPISITHGLLRFAQTKFSPNFFVYIFVNCFAAGALSMWLVGLSICALLSLVGAYPADFLFDETLPFYFLMGWPEAFITGLNLTLLVVWRPEWVNSFNDRVYLQRK
ncbi:energy-coupling factor ABC transporter permease [Deefgea rivuli]|uniref:energy-coupling factor ABC transporter permease n=1 Tax=Deefgea rivuli TaxID=400948 RepID=UPI000486F79D|nr:energy-coupling factor ABC transporter permease [Deefgea rivuli]